MNKSKSNTDKDPDPRKRVTRKQSTDQTSFLPLDPRTGKPSTIKPKQTSEKPANIDRDKESDTANPFKELFGPTPFLDKSGSSKNIIPEQAHSSKQQPEQLKNDSTHPKELNPFAAIIVSSESESESESKTKETESPKTPKILHEKVRLRINTYKIENSQLKKKNKELLEKIQRMANLALKDVIPSIPVFSGKMEDFDAFINTCSMMNELVESKPHLLTVIKAKISGEALAKVRPLDTINNWADLKKRLHERLRKPVTFEYAQADLSNIVQKPNESVEEFAKRTKEKFRILNEASKSISDVEAELAVLRKADEKLAITKFQQNLRNDTLRVLVSAANKSTLDENVKFTLEKEMIQNTGSVKVCEYCGKRNHS